MVDGQQSNTHSRRTNYSYIEEQNEARTELLNTKVNQLKHLAVQIGEETKFQNKYLKVCINNSDFSFYFFFIVHLFRNYIVIWKIQIV
jgi:predicted RNA-binding protein with EMAP domain